MQAIVQPLPFLASLRFDNAFARELPADPVEGTHRRQVHGALLSRVDPTPVSAPKLVAWSREMAERLGITQADLASPRFAEVFGGNALLEGMAPYAANYGGHQFGTWAGQLGDGRAITLGEVVNAAGERWELQLKGAGATPYSRGADGRAVLRSSIREFLCSEAMHHLGVPTTRALSLVATGESVIRDMFYDGNPRPEPGAVVCRVAPSFVRFGNFQILAAHGEHDALKKLLDYVIARHYPGLGVEAFYAEVCRRTALLMVDWMRLGFVHGVMNTDNMSILGLTIDYGPYGWLEGYDPGWTPNTADAEGRRYCYGNQPHIAQWNLARLAEALLPVVPDQKPLEDALTLYADTFNAGWQKALAAKLGVPALDRPEDDALVKDMLELFRRAETDFTLFFRNLARVAGPIDPLLPAFYAEPDATTRQAWEEWLKRYLERTKDIS